VVDGSIGAVDVDGMERMRGKEKRRRGKEEKVERQMGQL